MEVTTTTKATNVKPIGGYIELQLPEKEEYYPDLIKLNTGRNCLEYILRVKNYRLIHLPYFTCDVLLEPIQKLGVKVKFYQIDHNLNPKIDFAIGKDECFLYTNYFGIKQQTVSTLANLIENLVVDNSQAFFSESLPGIDTFYSCRKFFGVPDGAYLKLNKYVPIELEYDYSADRFSHLIKSIDFGIEAGYSDYLENNAVLLNNEIKHMSRLTMRMLSGINYKKCKAIRNTNFLFLHEALYPFNDLKIDTNGLNAPMAYPLLTDNPNLRAELIDRKIFVPTYWPNVFDWTTEDMHENYLANNLLALPIDHRYNENDMKQIVDVLNHVL